MTNDVRTHFSCSDELCEYMADKCGGVATLAFSTGKDSIVAWLKMQRYFKKITPYYLYSVPGNLEFIEKSLEYYEDWFGCHIIRLPHPAIYSFWGNAVFQSPENLSILENADLYMFDYEDINALVRATDPDLEKAYQASGVRSADSPMRRLTMIQHGAVNHGARRFFPVFDYKKEDMLKELDAAQIALPIDYEWFGRTFDGIDNRFMRPLREHAPEDYARVLRAYPMVELDILRQEWRAQYWEEKGAK